MLALSAHAVLVSYCSNADFFRVSVWVLGSQSNQQITTQSKFLKDDVHMKMEVKRIFWQLLLAESYT